MTVVVSAIVRRAHQILMIEQPDDERRFYWFIPGGVVETRETLTAALVREVSEETGLTLADHGWLAFVTQVCTGADARQTIAFVFEATTTHGEIEPNDPDRLTRQVAFVAVEEAIRRLEQVNWTPMRDPLIAYPKGDSRPGSVWQYDESGPTTAVLAHMTM